MQLNASEIFGNISTNPQVTSNETHNYSDTQEDIKENKSPKIEYSNNTFLFPVNQKDNIKKVDEIVTLGIETYVDGTLLRDADGKIYLINNGFKIHIPNLKKLQEFAGKIIYDVKNKELENYKNKKYFIGDLIRKQGDIKIFVITDNGLKYILNLEELRLNYFGLEIFNVDNLEFSLY